MTILVFGKTGQVARSLQAIGGVDTLSREDTDLGNPDECAAAIFDRKPSAVINAAAYTAVDRAEDDEVQAQAVNGHSPTAMAGACANLGIPLVHISTDYVFDGAGDGPFQPDGATAPLGAYGRTKLIGEQGVVAAGGTHAVLRTSWVFSEFGANFVKTMLRLGAERDRLTIVADQIGGPTPADAIARACLSIAHELREDAGKSGIYHFSGGPDASWADFAREIFRQAKLDCEVEDIPTSAYPTPAQRPLEFAAGLPHHTFNIRH